VKTSAPATTVPSTQTLPNIYYSKILILCCHTLFSTFKSPKIGAFKYTDMRVHNLASTEHFKKGLNLCMLNHFYAIKRLFLRLP